MYIRRKVFSKVMTTEGEEKLFSTADISVNSENGEVRLFSKKSKDSGKKTERKVNLGKSNRGYGRAVVFGGVVPGAAGVYAGSKAADKAAEEGKSELEVVKAAKKRAGRVGAVVGGALGAHGASKQAKVLANLVEAEGMRVPKGVKGAAIASGAALGAGMAGLMARSGARKNTEKRIEKGKKKN